MFKGGKSLLVTIKSALPAVLNLKHQFCNSLAADGDGGGDGDGDVDDDDCVCNDDKDVSPYFTLTRV